MTEPLSPKKEETEWQSISLIKKESKTIVRVNPNSLLKKLRNQLEEKKLMVKTDLFTFQKSDILKEDEESIKVSEILGKNTEICLKPKESFIQGGTVDKPGDVIPIVDVKPTLSLPDNWSSIPPTVELDRPGVSTGPGISTGTGDAFFNLPSDAKAKLEANILQMYNGIIVDERGLRKTAEPSIIHTVYNPAKGVIPTIVFDMDASLSFSKTTHEIRKMSTTATNASFGIFGIQLSAKYSESQENISSSEETLSYISSCYSVDKVELTLTEEDINGNRILYTTPAFTNAIKKALDFPHEAGAYKILMDEVLTQFGFYVATKVSVGGKLFLETQEKISSWADAEKKKQEYGFGLQASLTAGSVPVSGGIGFSQGLSEEEKNSLLQKFQRLRKNAIGGNAALVPAPSQWISSLESYETWRTIDYKKIKPSLAFLPDRLGSKCARLILGCVDEEPLQSKIHEVVDLKSYARSVMNNNINLIQPNPVFPAFSKKSFRIKTVNKAL